MKKIALSLAVIATLAMVSCGNKAKTEDTAAIDTQIEAVSETDTMITADSDTAVATQTEVTETVAPAADNKDDKAAKTEEPAKADSAKK